MQRLPPNQRLTSNFPVLHFGRVPEFDKGTGELVDGTAVGRRECSGGNRLGDGEGRIRQLRSEEPFTIGGVRGEGDRRQGGDKDSESSHGNGESYH